MVGWATAWLAVFVVSMIATVHTHTLGSRTLAALGTVAASVSAAPAAGTGFVGVFFLILGSYLRQIA